MIAGERTLVDDCRRFAGQVEAHKRELLALLRRLQAEGKRVVGYGASTKGNVLLQYCGIDASLVSCIAEVNPDMKVAFAPVKLLTVICCGEMAMMLPRA